MEDSRLPKRVLFGELAGGRDVIEWTPLMKTANGWVSRRVSGSRALRTVSSGVTRSLP